MYEDEVTPLREELRKAHQVIKNLTTVYMGADLADMIFQCDDGGTPCFDMVKFNAMTDRIKELEVQLSGTTFNDLEYERGKSDTKLLITIKLTNHADALQHRVLDKGCCKQYAETELLRARNWITKGE